MIGRRPCPVAGCTHHAMPGKLMCEKHWYALPQHVRSTITEKWRACLKYPPGTPARSRGPVLRAYKRVADLAVTMAGIAPPIADERERA